MNEDIVKLKRLVEEYVELCEEAEQMSDDWENGSECEAAMADPSDQYMKGIEIKEKCNEIKSVLNSI